MVRSLNGCIINADRGYGKRAFIRLLMEHCLGSVFLMPEYLMRCHPFLVRSLLDPFRNEIEERLGNEEENMDAVLLKREQGKSFLETLKKLFQTPSLPGTALLVQGALVPVKWWCPGIVGHKVMRNSSTMTAAKLS